MKWLACCFVLDDGNGEWTNEFIRDVPSNQKVTYHSSDSCPIIPSFCPIHFYIIIPVLFCWRAISRSLIHGHTTHTIYLFISTNEKRPDCGIWNEMNILKKHNNVHLHIMQVCNFYAYTLSMYRCITVYHHYSWWP